MTQSCHQQAQTDAWVIVFIDFNACIFVRGDRICAVKKTLLFRYDILKLLYILAPRNKRTNLMKVFRTYNQQQNQQQNQVNNNQAQQRVHIQDRK